ncbi:MAG: flavin reductase family protein [Albidovulum sp.]|nr:flavin reductase family protein [Albidovulum sp.]MDE0303969.1 flavin reductase family protein [Albidovulum sp.]MDE0532477.1 flavin reductase family protein [Albidovulum sp.]
MEPGALDARPDLTRSLRNAFGCFASGVAVVSVLDRSGSPTGITVNSFSSLSLEPALLLFSIGCEQASARWFHSQDSFNVNVLCREQEHLAWQFAKPLENKFARVDSWRARNGVPVIDGAMAFFVCRKYGIVEGGDHQIVIGEILDFGTRDAEPLVYLKGRMREIAAERRPAV